jgi:hypothetical protein
MGGGLMTWGMKIFFGLVAALMLHQLIFHGPQYAFFTLIAAGVGIAIWECLQGIVSGILRLFSGRPHVEYHFHVWEPEKGAERHPDPTASQPWEDIDMVERDGIWRKR